MKYRYLFSKGYIGKLTLQNRVIMPGMCTNLAGANGEVTDHLLRYYEERAMGGTGLIITEFAVIDHELGKGAVNQLRISHDSYVTGFYRLANVVHKYGSKLFVQLHHAGRESNSLLTDGKQIVAPSPVTCEAIGEKPRELTTEEVKELVKKFVTAAIRCKEAGVDGVELHGAHGYLISQFLNPHTNLRTDMYGGSFANRMRFLEEIIIGIKEQCGNDYPVIVRLSVDEFDEDGIDVALSKNISRYLEKIGVDAIHASAGNYNSMEKVIESPLYEQGWRVYLAEEIKKEVNIPVITVGSIREPKYVESILAEGKADFVAIGRGHIADPEWTKKTLEGREKEIRLCISCLHCAYSKGHISCSINVRAGRELEFNQFRTIGESHHVVIVGGGPGGMEAARILTLKGYTVTILEKANELGGQLQLVTEPVYKKKMNWYIDYLVHEMERLKVDIRLNEEATVEKIRSFHPHAVILATGGKPLIPQIKGIEQPHIYNYQEVKLEQKVVKNSKVAAIGSGMVCHSTVRKLIEAGNEVVLVEVPTKSSCKISPQTRARLLTKLKKMGATVITNHNVRKILPNAILIEEENSGEQMEIVVDQVVIAMGVTSYNPLEIGLREHLDNVFVIGDAAGHVSLGEATKGGFETGYALESLVRQG
ncbi:FAD-dependent oxidoreductase [Evansella cellulosilytica]|uniref:NADH:flavin oxidoreductase/NADH oxidase n=1 Tax=Evansella cellulosilytica (strain ATCC 21833 / DSM 2522 / FERM P-1141 / JCM 9156 / N-4) TaxID=649639 RepID=E6TRS3_EVAC2|nr:FAD-dependent oxidoreductase [Evansella cellulosilytica]ADU29446.1 NADH:flavin oxidoreductase/NADH oxidase [Evansella cellulosilytica DSM 2522]